MLCLGEQNERLFLQPDLSKVAYPWYALEGNNRPGTNPSRGPTTCYLLLANIPKESSHH